MPPLEAARAAAPLAVAMRPGSTAEDLFQAAKHEHPPLLEGDLVRVEVLSAGSEGGAGQACQRRAVPRDALLSGQFCGGKQPLAVRLVATRRSRWQRGAAVDCGPQ